MYFPFSSLSTFPSLLDLTFWLFNVIAYPCCPYPSCFTASNCVEIWCIAEEFLQCRSKWSISMRKLNLWYFFSSKFGDKKRGKRKKNPFKQNDISSISVLYQEFSVMVILSWKSCLDLRRILASLSFLFPQSLMYIEAVINSKGLCKNCMMLNPKCERELGPERESGREGWLQRELQLA